LSIARATIFGLATLRYGAWMGLARLWSFGFERYSVTAIVTVTHPILAG
jgi:hypothetical protein